MRRLFILVICLVAFPASANWSKDPAGTGDDCRFSRKDRVCYFNQSDASTNSASLDTRACKTISFELNADIDVDSSGGGVAGATGYIRRCSSSTVSLTSCNRVFTDSGNVTLNGDPTVGRSGHYGNDGSFYFFEIISNAATDNYRVEATCTLHPR